MSRFCVIDCEDSVAYDPQTFGLMFQSQLSRDGDNWTVCYLARGEPLPKDILDFQGIVITGSHFNCRDGNSLPWFEPLCDVIRHAASQGHPKMYGGCYGCQIIAHALEGSVDYNPTGRFLLMAEKIKCSEEGLDILPVNVASSLRPLLDQLQSQEGMNLLVSHGDCVRTIPSGSILLAYSESCATEMFITGNKFNILACQSHPEFDVSVIQDIIWPLITKNGRLNEEEKELYSATLMKYSNNDAKLMMNVICNFLRLRD